MASFSKDIYEEFFKIFAKSVKSTLTSILDEDICSNIEMNFTDFKEARNINDYKQGNTIYKIDYVASQKSGKAAILIEEGLIACISDVLTGGSGVNIYKGQLSEIETNSVSKIVTSVFNDLENAYKSAYDATLVFGTTFSTLLKESDDYETCLDEYSFNFIVNSTLSLNSESIFSVNLLFNIEFLESLMKVLGYSESGITTRRKERLKIDLDCLSDISIDITAELGRCEVPIKYALELTNGSVVELDTQNNADIKIFANGLEFAYAQIVAVDGYFGIKITKILSQEERLEGIIN